MKTQKLKHLLTKKGQWNLLFRALLLTAFLAAFSFSSKLWAAVFLFSAAIFYFIEPRAKEKLKVSYWMLAFLAPAAIYFVSQAPVPPSVIFWVKIVILLVSGAAFGAIMTLFEYYLEDRMTVYTFINTLLLVLTFAVGVSLSTPYTLGWVAAFVFVVLFLIFREIFVFAEVTNSLRILDLGHKRTLVASLVAALLGVELMWFAVILPMGVINTSVFLAMVFVILRDIILAHYEGRLTHGFILKQFTFFVLLTIIIFASTSWSI